MPFLMNRFTGGDKLAVGLFTLVSSLAAAAAMLVLGAASDRVVPRMGRAPIILGLLALLDAGAAVIMHDPTLIISYTESLWLTADGGRE